MADEQDRFRGTRPRDTWRDRDAHHEAGDREYGRSYGQRDDYGRTGRDYGRTDYAQGMRDDMRDWSGRRTEDNRGYGDTGHGGAATPGYGYGSGYEDDDRRGSVGRADADRHERGGRNYGGLAGGWGGPGGGAWPPSDYGGAMGTGAQHDRDPGRDRGGRSGGPYGGASYAGRGDRSSGYRPRDDDRHGDDRGFFTRAADEVATWFGSDEAERRRERDARHGDEGAQHHVGRGPRNYTRSDSRVQEDINERLTADPYVDASDIDVRVDDGEVTLSGHVDSRAAKRRAEDIADAVTGVRHVQNNLRIAGQGRATGSSGGETLATLEGGELQGRATAPGGSAIAHTGSDQVRPGDTGSGSAAAGRIGQSGATTSTTTGGPAGGIGGGERRGT